jgi:hypothetical protein
VSGIGCDCVLVGRPMGSFGTTMSGISGGNAGGSAGPSVLLTFAWKGGKGVAIAGPDCAHPTEVSANQEVTIALLIRFMDADLCEITRGGPTRASNSEDVSRMTAQPDRSVLSVRSDCQDFSAEFDRRIEKFT